MDLQISYREHFALHSAYNLNQMKSPHHTFLSRSLAVCLAGRCERVGCDLKVGSGQLVDRCGVCGGDGSSCPLQEAFSWVSASLSPCSTTCGPGQEVWGEVCQDSRTGETVHQAGSSSSTVPNNAEIFSFYFKPFTEHSVKSTKRLPEAGP